MRKTGSQLTVIRCFSSSDLGKTWRNRRPLGTCGEVYPSILELQDGRLLLTYTVRKWKLSPT